ncbi:MAG: hypothetical protein J5935_07985 [Lachnospiraceae bacterium]|nr:hypothetical protein [Lachnospiraceae bacterium]
MAKKKTAETAVQNADEVIHVKMLGSFSLNYHGHEVALGRNNSAKFIQLLQIMWLMQDKGVTKDRLISTLYERDSLSNANNSFNNLVYQMRKQMISAGLPDAEYVIKKDKLFYADYTIPIEVDATRFKTLCEQAETMEDGPEKYAMYREAFDLYAGELLPEISTELWVITESISYRKMYEQCVDWMGQYLRSISEYDEMQEIFGRAVSIYRDNDWQIDQIDALLAKGEYKEAYALYKTTVHMYADEMGLPPSEKLQECFRKMSNKLTSLPGEITEIQSDLRRSHELVDDGNANGGAYYCTYPSFVDAYHILGRNMERSGQSIFMMLCSLVDYEGKQFRDQRKIKTYSAMFQDVLQEILRRGDTFCRYSQTQFLILLVGTAQEGCEVVYGRIEAKVRELVGTRVNIRYNIVSIADLPESEEGDAGFSNRWHEIAD